MSYISELKEEIKFTSPSGNVFRGLWRNNERSQEKKLGMFDPPNFHGTIVQDLGVKSMMYPLTIYFDGPFHNKDAKDFSFALGVESGQWEVIHPAKGPLILQLISFKESVSPVDNGYAEFDTQWIEPANIERFINPDELAESLLTSAINAIGDAIIGLGQLRADAYGSIASAVGQFNKSKGFMDKIFKEINATKDLARDSYESARAVFVAKAAESTVDFAEMGSAISDMMNSPLLAVNTFSEGSTVYDDLIAALSTNPPVATTNEDYNKIIVMEYTLTLALITMAQMLAVTQFQSRSEVISAIEKLTDTFNNIVATIEAVQEMFAQ